REEQLALLRAHPDLAGQEARAGTMTHASVAEQASAALDRLTPGEMERIAKLNAAYRARHGFPFIIAVRQHARDGILNEFERRLRNDSESEIAANLQQISVITRLRLVALFGPHDANREPPVRS
ncbi:MAG: 2-oxo-4-hydroxy-4-carboxy-5-ureidoimidazoline decarboxylase, partial [Betaproteobacteria bacterium]